MVSGAPLRTEAEAEDAVGKESVKVHLSRNLRVDSPLRSSLTSGIDRHAGYDLVPAPPPSPPPPHLLLICLNFNGFFISCFQLNSLALVILNKSSLLSLTHTANIYKYIHTHTQHRLFFCFGCVFGCASSEPG